MPVETIRLHHAAPTKPMVGQPCNGCGVCCALETCPVARLRFLRIKGPCPALTWSEAEARYRCDFLIDPAKYLGWLPARSPALARRLLARWIAAGAGCDCSVDVQP